MKKFKNVKAVLEYLQSGGHQVTPATLYRHAKSGRLVTNADGTVNESSVIGYAKIYLADGSDAAADGDLQRKKQIADTCRAEALAKVAQAKAKEADDAYILKSEYRRALAERAMLFKSDLSNWMYQMIPEICAVLGGDHELIPDGIQTALRGLEKALGRYSETDKSFSVPEDTDG